ncbi:MAG: hypothetical protein WBX81_05460 [Nitrososphaeraceae archaeon]
MKSVKIPKSSTTGVTFRLPSEKLNTLRKVSKTKNITPNTLVNQIIKAYLDLHLFLRGGFTLASLSDIARNLVKNSTDAI